MSDGKVRGARPGGRSIERRGDVIRRGPNQHGGAGATAQLAREGREVDAFAHPAQDQDRRPIESVERGESRGRRRRGGVIDPEHAGDLVDTLQPVCHALELAQRAGDLGRGHAHGLAGDRGRERVRDVMAAHDAQLARFDERDLLRTIAEHEPT